jgi:uncharacterized membrane protein YkvA (DUF1232 family)
VPAIHVLKRLRTLVRELPQQLRLAYCLARDPSTPAPLKAALGGALALILNPAIDFPAWVPVVGQMDTIALTLVTVRTFNAQAPKELREEIEAQIKAGQSRFDLDLRLGTETALRLTARVRALPAQLRAQPRPGHPSAPPAWYRSPTAAGGRAGRPGGEAGSEGPPPPASEEHWV